MREEVELMRMLQCASGMIAKKQILQENRTNKNFLHLLYYALNPLLSYKISEQTLSKTAADDNEAFDGDIFALCEELASRKALDDATIRSVKAFLNMQTSDIAEFYTQLLSKTLRLGVTASTVNKVIPGLIPEWQVQQAFPIEKYSVTDGTEFWLTQKLNGIRATYYKGRLFSRTGIPYGGLEHIIKQISALNLSNWVLDGELTVLEDNSKNDNELFRITTGICNSENDDKTSILFNVFDILPEDEFSEGVSSMTYSERRAILDELSKQIEGESSVRILPILYHGNDISQINCWLDRMVDRGKEGLMLNLDTPYKCRRHNGILKIKRFYTMDLPIIDCEEGSGRLAGVLGALVLEYKGNKVRVGSGFSDDQRIALWGRRNELPGILCEVKYKDISSNKNTGTESLQFPVFVSLRTDKEEESYG